MLILSGSTFDLINLIITLISNVIIFQAGSLRMNDNEAITRCIVWLPFSLSSDIIRSYRADRYNGNVIEMRLSALLIISQAPRSVPQ